MADSGDTSPNPRLDELLTLDQPERLALIETISAKGFEPGCWIRIDDDDLTHSAIAARDAIYALIEIDELDGDLSRIAEFNGEHPWQPPDDEDDAWIIISQSCELVRDVREEPLVQLALLRHAREQDDLASWSRNSARYIPIDPTGKGSRYYVDLRVQAFVPKHMVAPLDVRQAIPADADFDKQRPRTRFALRVGQRHSRIGIPTSVVEEIVAPLVDAIAKDKKLRAQLDTMFSEWLLLQPEQESDQLILLAITPYEPDCDDFRAAEDLFFEEFWDNALSDELRERLDEERSTVVPLTALTVPVWLSAWKLELDFLTYGSKGDPESPEPGT